MQEDLSKDVNETSINLNEKNQQKNKYYLPICREKGCEGILNIEINEEKFIINCQCEKNKSHIFNNIYFETFDKYYLKEKLFQKCSNCFNILENRDKYTCIECNEIYCQSCFILDKHIQQNMKNLKIISNKCPIDKNELINYCLDCKQKICEYCSKQNLEKTPFHENHKVKNILKEMPSLNEINCLKQRIMKKSEAFDALIKSIDEWLLELNKRIERIKLNLKNEIYLLKKILFNFNSDYMDYTYYSNFHSFYTKIKNYNSENLKKFMQTSNFDMKTKCISNLFSNENHILTTNYKLQKIFDQKFSGILLNFPTNKLLSYSYYNNNMRFITIEKNKIIIGESLIKFNEKISALNISTDGKQIYACLSCKKCIHIIEYNSKMNSLKLIDKIHLGSYGQFIKCIDVKSNYLLTADYDSIYLWYKEISKEYFCIYKINERDKIYDICQINEKSFIATRKSKIVFFSCLNLNKEKVIKNIDCIDDIDTIISIKDIALINCKKGIAIISVKFKELIQYIENWDVFEEKKILKSNGDIYVSNVLGDLFKVNLEEQSLVLKEKIKINKTFYDANKYDENILESFDFNKNNYIIKDDNIFIWDDIIYTLVSY